MRKRNMKNSSITTAPKLRRKPLRIKNILVPIDFSEMSIGAIETAKQLARRFGANVHLANIRESSYPADFLELASPFAYVPLTYLEDTREAAEKRLHDLAREHELSGTFEAEVGGPAFDEICKIARKLRADLIVTPTHGRGGVEHVLLGSTAERLVQHSPCPVFVTRERKRARPARAKSLAAAGRIDTILVPVDFSHSSLVGLNYAIQFADKVAARIVVLSVVHFDYAYTADGYAMYDLAPLEEAARKEAEREMSYFVRRATFGAVKFETAVKIGPPVHEICRAAEEQQTDLIIIPTHGYTGFKHIMIGSTAEHVVRRASCPVMVVPSHPEIRADRVTGQTQRAQKPTRKVTTRSTIRPRLLKNGRLAKKNQRAFLPPVPERRQTNKFRESHSL